MEQDFANDTLEKLVLKKALSDQNWLNCLSKINDARWYSDIRVRQTIGNAIAFYKKHGYAPTTKITVELAKLSAQKHPDSGVTVAGVQQLLSEIASMDFGQADDLVNSNVREFVRRGAFYNALFDNAEQLEKRSGDYRKVVDDCLANFDRVQKIVFSDVDIGMDYFDPDHMAAHWEYVTNPEAKIKTGWESVDRFTNGGFLKGGKMLALFMAQAGLGKSVFLSNLAVNFLKQDLSVVVISLEMSQDVYATRFDAHISSGNINQLGEDPERAKKRIEQFHAAHPKARLYVKEHPPRSVSTKDIELYLDNLRAAGKTFDVVVVDYLNLVLPNRRTDSMFKDGLAVSEELRALSYKYGCPVVSAVQCNTEGMASAEIDMQNVSESRGIVHTVDALFALYQLDEDRENGVVNLKVVKNRLGGMVGKHASFKLDPDNLTLADITFDGSFSQTVDSGDKKLNDMIMNLPDLSSDVQNI